MHPGDTWTDYWHRRPLRSFCVWHPASDILKHSNSRKNGNFFPLFFISRKILTVTFWDFLKTCGGDTYLDAKKDRMCNYSLLAKLQVSDNSKFWSPNQGFHGSLRICDGTYTLYSGTCAASVLTISRAGGLLIPKYFSTVALTRCSSFVWYCGITVWHPLVSENYNLN